MDISSFYRGHSFDAHEYFGAHIIPEGVSFRTFAPNAQAVSLLIHERELPMTKVYNGQFYELTVPDARPGDTYEYRIYTQSGCQDHCDPYGFQMELRPAHKSIVCDLSYTFHDSKWISQRSDRLDKPLNIYELHLGSWRRHENGQWYSYLDTAQALIPYLKAAGYNYVELLPISEHPCDESWGYQNTGFFAPTSRYGTPVQLMELVDLLHQNGIGVILDYVPVHFAIDAYALARYDGTALYEYPHEAVGVSEWGSYNFMHSRGEVRSLLQSAANYWLTYYHFDGLRMDAISRIIYWQGDERRGVNGNALDFIKTMNTELKRRHKGCILIAEDSTNFPKVTHPVEQSGLGFDYKWDMGWMHDTLSFLQLPPDQRPGHYHKLTFSMHYFPNERYLLPLSHDEVVHGKGTILNKMYGTYEEKFPQARAMYLYMAVHPGKKLDFMGNELGQLREWDEKRQQDHDLRRFPVHDSFYRFMSELNAIYLTSPALSQWDYRPEGFGWIDCDQAERCIYALRRRSEDQELIAVFNFSADTHTYDLPTNLELLLHTDWEKYGGHTLEIAPISSLPPFSGLLLKVR